MEDKNQENESISDSSYPGLRFIEEIKKQYGETSKTKEEFLNTVIQYDKSQYQVITLQQMKERVHVLFAGNPSLIDSFNSFLPEDEKYLSSDASVNHYKESDIMFVQQFIQRIQDSFPDNAQVYQEFVSLISNQLNGHIDFNTVIQEAQRLFYGHPDLLNDFVCFLLPDLEKARMSTDQPMYTIPSIPSVQSMPAMPTMHAMPQIQAISFYPQYIQPTSYTPSIPQMSSVSYYSQPPVQNHQKSSVSKPSQESTSDSITKRNESKESSFDLRSFEYVKTEGGEMKYSQFLRLCHLLAEEVISVAEFVEMVEMLYHHCNSVLKVIFELLKHHHIPSEFITKAPTALLPEQVKKLPRCTPSYHLLPSEYLHRGGSQRSYQQGRLLNDTWISCAIGSEDFNSGVSHRNTYAEAMFRVEDDRFETDILIETNRHCIARLEVLKKELEETEQGDYRMKLSSLSDLDKRAIRRLYSEYGVDGLVLEMLEEIPKTTIPIVIQRLKEKEEEWMREKCSLEAEWRQIQQDNYCRSLDIRSSSFKTQDKKVVNAKVFTDSIKSIVDEKVADYPTSIYIQMKQAGFDFQESHLSFSMTHPSVHRAVVKILLAGSKRNLPYSDLKRFRTILSYLVCHIFGLNESVIEDCESKNLMFLQNHDFVDKDIEVSEANITDDQSFVFFCNNSFYVFYRFYQLLYSRLEVISQLCEAASNHLNEFQITHTVKREAHLDSYPPSCSSSERFNQVINHVILLIRNEEDNSVFEEASRQLVGARGYILYTVDKVISSCFKHVHSLFNEPINNELIACFAFFEQQTDKTVLAGYRNQVIRMMNSYHEPIYRIVVKNGYMQLWFVGNSHELQQNGQTLTSAEDFSKFARDFLSAQGSSMKSSRSNPSFVDMPDDDEGGQEYSEEEHCDIKKKVAHPVRRNLNRRKNQEDAEWHDF